MSQEKCPSSDLKFKYSSFVKNAPLLRSKQQYFWRVGAGQKKSDKIFVVSRPRAIEASAPLPVFRIAAALTSARSDARFGQRTFQCRTSSAATTSAACPRR